MARIELKLNQFMEEVRSGKRESSVASHGPELLDQEQESEEGWLQLRRELEDMGVSSEVLSQRKHFVVNWFRHALEQEDNKDRSASSTFMGSDNSVEAPETLDQDKTTAISDAQTPEQLDPTLPDDSSERWKGTAVTLDSRNRLPKSSLKNGRSLILASRLGDTDSVVRLL